MSERLANTVSRIGQRKSAVVLALLACLLFVAGCAQRDTSSDKDQPGGFYGGLSAGKGM
jgi:hypothetical protein